MKINLTQKDIYYLLRVTSYNAVDNTSEGVKEDRRVYNKLKKQMESYDYVVEKF
jgi:hypothetical protein